MDNDYCSFQMADGVAQVTLARGSSANVLSEGMLAALEQGFHRAEQEASARVIVLAAEGKIFCAGHDLGEMTQHHDEAYFDELFARCSRFMLSLRSCRLPVIAKVQGAAVAAGCQLVASCDLAYAADHAKFGVNGINLGLFCSTPSVALSRAVQPRQALELLLTGDLITARRAVELGLVNAAVPADQLDVQVARVAASMAAKSPAAIALGKRLFWQQLGQDEAEAYGKASHCMAQNIGFPETRSRIAAFLAKTH